MPRNTHTPLTRSASLSTALHCSQLLTTYLSVSNPMIPSDCYDKSIIKNSDSQWRLICDRTKHRVDCRLWGPSGVRSVHSCPRDLSFRSVSESLTEKVRVSQPSALSKPSACKSRGVQITSLVYNSTSGQKANSVEKEPKVRRRQRWSSCTEAQRRNLPKSSFPAGAWQK